MSHSIDLLAPGDPFWLNSGHWPAVFAKLVRYARTRLRNDCRESARDLVQDAVVQVCKARPASEAGGGGADITFLLYGAVNGLAMNERRRWRHTREVVTDHQDLATIGGGETPEDLVIAVDECARIFGALHERFAGDVVGSRIVDLFERRVLEAAEQAVAANLPIDEIRNGRRRVLSYVETLRAAPAAPRADTRKSVPGAKRRARQGARRGS